MDATNAALSVAASNTAGVASFNARVGAVTLTAGDVTGAGGAPTNAPSLFNPNIRDSSGNAMITFDTTYKTFLQNPIALGDGGNLTKMTNFYLELSSTGGELKVGSLHEFALAAGGSGANVEYGGNTYGTMISPMFVGSGAGLSDVRPYGPEIWQNQPLPVMMWSFYSVANVTLTQPWWMGETNAQAVALMLSTNGIFTGTTNYGIRNPVMLNGMWIQTNRSDSGTLLESTANYPNGITNTVSYIRSLGSEVWLDIMYASRTPVAPYTEMIADVGTGIWYGDGIGASAQLMSNGVSVPWPATAAAQPMMTANTVRADIAKLYEWGIEGVMVLDQGNPVAWPANSYGYRSQMHQQVCHAVNYCRADPSYGFGEFYGWWAQPVVGTYPHRYQARHLMSVTMWQPKTLHDPVMAYSCNNYGFDTGGNDESCPGSRITGAGFAFSKVSAPLSWATNLPDGSTHYMFQQMEWEGGDFNSWTTNDWQAVFGMQAVWHATMQFSWPFDYVTNGWWQNCFTNAGFLTALADPGQHTVHCSRFGTNNSIFWNHVTEDRDARVVLFSNTQTNANTSTNLTITWAELLINTNLVCKVTDVWSGADLGEHTNTITLAVSNSATRFFTMTPVRFQGATGGAPLSIGITIDGGGSAITTGIKGYVHVPYACTINSVTMLADQTGTLVVDIYRCTYAQFDASATHPVAGDKLTASAPPTITSTYKAQDSTLTGWTTSLAANDVLEFIVTGSPATITRATVQLKATR
jgi:hypothetical protein